MAVTISATVFGVLTLGVLITNVPLAQSYGVRILRPAVLAPLVTGQIRVTSGTITLPEQIRVTGGARTVTYHGNDNNLRHFPRPHPPRPPPPTIVIPVPVPVPVPVGGLAGYFFNLQTQAYSNNVQSLVASGQLQQYIGIYLQHLLIPANIQELQKAGINVNALLQQLLNVLQKYGSQTDPLTVNIIREILLLLPGLQNPSITSTYHFLITLQKILSGDLRSLITSGDLQKFLATINLPSFIQQIYTQNLVTGAFGIDLKLILDKLGQLPSIIGPADPNFDQWIRLLYQKLGGTIQLITPKPEVITSTSKPQSDFDQVINIFIQLQEKLNSGNLHELINSGDILKLINLLRLKIDSSSDILKIILHSGITSFDINNILIILKKLVDEGLVGRGELFGIIKLIIEKIQNSMVQTTTTTPLVQTTTTTPLVQTTTTKPFSDVDYATYIILQLQNMVNSGKIKDFMSSGEFQKFLTELQAIIARNPNILKIIFESGTTNLNATEFLLKLTQVLKGESLGFKLYTDLKVLIETIGNLNVQTVTPKPSPEVTETTETIRQIQLLLKSGKVKELVDSGELHRLFTLIETKLATNPDIFKIILSGSGKNDIQELINYLKPLIEGKYFNATSDLFRTMKSVLEKIPGVSIILKTVTNNSTIQSRTGESQLSIVLGNDDVEEVSKAFRKLTELYNSGNLRSLIESGKLEELIRSEQFQTLLTSQNFLNAMQSPDLDIKQLIRIITEILQVQREVYGEASLPSWTANIQLLLERLEISQPTKPTHRPVKDFNLKLNDGSGAIRIVINTTGGNINAEIGANIIKKLHDIFSSGKFEGILSSGQLENLLSSPEFLSLLQSKELQSLLTSGQFDLAELIRDAKSAMAGMGSGELKGIIDQLYAGVQALSQNGGTLNFDLQTIIKKPTPPPIRHSEFFNISLTGIGNIPSSSITNGGNFNTADLVAQIQDRLSSRNFKSLFQDLFTSGGLSWLLSSGKFQDLIGKLGSDNSQEVIKQLQAFLAQKGVNLPLGDLQRKMEIYLDHTSPNVFLTNGGLSSIQWKSGTIG